MGTGDGGLSLCVLAGRYAVCRLAPDAAVPAWFEAGELRCAARTADELSLVCASDAVPGGVRAERGFVALRVEGTLDLGLVGVLAGLATALAEAGVSLLALSTFDTDYLLVRAGDLARALEALRAAGHRVRDA